MSASEDPIQDSAFARLCWWGPVGLFVVLCSTVACATDQEGLNSVFYIPAWFGYLAVIDAVIFYRRGSSFLTAGRRELGAMVIWSIPFWFIFEAYNFVLRNWYYVFVPRSPIAQALMSTLSYATVFPACFFHAELLRTFGFFDRSKWPAWRPGRGFRIGLAVFGGLAIILPLLLPRYAFWMVWAAAILIPALVNRRCGAPSLLRDLEEGRPARLLQLFVGGLLAGLAWEGLNYGARCKWIYTVPGLEDSKLFEMPWLGFLGFPLLSLGAFESYACFCHFVRGGRWWELRKEARGEISPRPIAKRRYVLALLFGIVISVSTHREGMVRSVRSMRPVLEELNSLTASERQRLRDFGLGTPERLWRAVDSDGLASISARTGIAFGAIHAGAEHASLALHKGMGPRAANLLFAAGIRGVENLVDADAEELHGRLAAVALDEGDTPTRAEVAVWIRAANPSGKPSR